MTNDRLGMGITICQRVRIFLNVLDMILSLLYLEGFMLMSMKN